MVTFSFEKDIARFHSAWSEWKYSVYHKVDTPAETTASSRATKDTTDDEDDTFYDICEMFSVMLQVGYFKLTHGKRLFKMSPIHHHFEMCGWSEVKIVAVFSAVTALFGAGSFLLVLFGV